MLEDRYKETKEDDYMNLLEVYIGSKMANTVKNLEDWILKIEDTNERISGVDTNYEKFEAEIKM